MELNSEEVLRHLKALGYENIENNLLQQFMKDLKKLIKYEKQKSKDDEKMYININSHNNFPFNEKKRVLSNNHCKNSRCNNNINNVYERLSCPSSKKKLCSKAVKTVGVQTNLQSKQIRNIKPVLKKKQMDPVSLHHYYQTEWLNHKIPGEKNHDQLRWKIRQMMTRK